MNPANTEEEDVAEDGSLLSTRVLCRTLQKELHNMGKALSCPLCLSTYRDAVTLPCCHAYCRSCLTQALATGSARRPPTCPCCQQRTAGRRSLTDAPKLNELVRAYKLALRHFGLAPVRYEEALPMTQLVPSTPDESPLDTVDVHQHLQAARVFAQAWDGPGDVPYRDEQDLVVAANRRFLLQAAVAAQAKPQSSRNTNSTTLSYSQLANQAAEQSAADRNDETSPCWWEQRHEKSQSTVVRFRSQAEPEGLVEASPPHTTAAGAIASMQAGMDGPSLRDTKPPALASPTGAPSTNSEHDDDDDDCTVDPDLPIQNVSTYASFARDVPSPATLWPLSPSNAAERVHAHDNDELTVDPDTPTNAYRIPSPPTIAKLVSTDKLSPVRPHDVTGTTVDTTMEVSMTTVTSFHTTTDTSRMPVAPPPVGPTLPTTRPHSGVTESTKPSTPPTERLQRTRTPSPAHVRPAPAQNGNDASVAESSDLFPVGAIVQVQPRTWPGVNKPGGVGRVVTVHTHVGNAAVQYDVAYVLGGRERRVDAVFVANQPAKLGTTTELVSATPTTTECMPRSRASYRIKHKREEEIPSFLLEQLAKEGFDTKGTVAPVQENMADAAGAVENQRADSKPIQQRFGRKRSATTASKSNPTKRTRRKENVHAPARAMATSTAPTVIPPDPILPISREEALVLADQLYQSRIQKAIQSGVIHVVASSLSDRDREELQFLCSETGRGKVKVVLSDTIQSKTTTLCLLPVDPHSSITENAQALTRTLKAMQSALVGIPIVSPAWVTACRQAKDAVVPSANMYVRTLPTKSNIHRSDFGLATLAATIEHRGIGSRPLHRVAVYLCGSYSRRKQTDMSVLFRLAGVKVLTHVSAALAHGKYVQSKQTLGTKLVLLCEGDAGITSAMEKLIRQPDSKRCVQVVDSSWFFDSISCGKALPSNGYMPASGKACQLWTVLQDAGNS